MHIDGFIAVAAHTLIVPADATATTPAAATPESPAPAVSIPGAVAISAAWVAAELAVKLVKNGGTNSAVTAAVVRTLMLTSGANLLN